MNIEIREYMDFDLDEITGLYQAVGWTNYTARAGMLREAYEHSLCVLGAYLGDRLIGILRAVGDGVSIVLIQDLLVLPEYQRPGVCRLSGCSNKADPPRTFSMRGGSAFYL